MEITGTHCNCWWECKMVQLLWQTVFQSLQKVNIELPHESEIPLKHITKRSENILT